MTIIEKARNLALELHKNQFRKDGKPYFTHLEAVAELTKEILIKESYRQELFSNLISAAYLHDSLEDQGATLEMFLNAGLNENIFTLVDVLSRKARETYLDFILRIKRSDYYRLVLPIKLADLQHNMSDLEEGSLKDKYRFADYVLRN